MFAGRELRGLGHIASAVCADAPSGAKSSRDVSDPTRRPGTPAPGSVRASLTSRLPVGFRSLTCRRQTRSSVGRLPNTDCLTPTRSQILTLCLAPSRPLRFAPPARSAPLRALTAPALSVISHLRVGRCLLDKPISDRIMKHADCRHWRCDRRAAACVPTS